MRHPLFRDISNAFLFFLLCLLLFPQLALSTGTEDASAIVENSFDYLRGKTSTCQLKMTIHRPNWKRRLTIKAWTEGRKKSLFEIVSPVKDQGNATLKTAQGMWSYNPKVNRVVKIPPSMMGQEWMGSDFSNNDLSKSDSLLCDYTHTLTRTAPHEKFQIYYITSLPKPEKPVIWGMQKLRVRSDNVLLTQEFYDEDLQLTKVLETSEIQSIDSRLFPMVWRMSKAGTGEEYTEIEYQSLRFDLELEDTIFLLSGLKQLRR